MVMKIDALDNLKSTTAELSKTLAKQNAIFMDLGPSIPQRSLEAQNDILKKIEGLKESQEKELELLQKQITDTKNDARFSKIMSIITSLIALASLIITIITLIE